MSAPDPSYMRISDEERNDAVAQLRAALNAGRLSLDEFDRRSAAAYGASTYSELNVLLADLPGTTAPTPPYQYHPYGTQAGPGPTLPPYYAPVMPQQPQNGFGVAALVLGIVGICCCPAAILAVVFGGIGLGKANSGKADNRGLAVAGLVLGIVGLALLIVRVPLGFVF